MWNKVVGDLLDCSNPLSSSSIGRQGHDAIGGAVQSGAGTIRRHPVAAGIGLGITAIVTGGLSLAADGTAAAVLTGASVVTGGTAAALDGKKCLAHPGLSGNA